MKGSRMKTKLRIPLLSMGFGTLVFIGFAGTISGSLAWWAYSTRATVTYKGTSVASSEQLQIGIKTYDKTYADLLTLGMTKETVNGSNYYWCNAGAGLPAEIVKKYLELDNRYASDQLEPITSGSYTTGDLSLKNPLVSGNRINNTPASTDKYVHIPLAFKIMRYNNNNVLEAAKGENIWLSDTVVEALDTTKDGEVYKAIRMFTKGKYAVTENDVTQLVDVKKLINPSDKTSTTTGQTAVAGLLDISGSGYYDTYERNNGSYAIVYGETEFETEEALLAVETESTPTTTESYVDFNNTGHTELTTFNAKYFKDTLHPSSFTSIRAKYQIYDTLGTVKPTDDNGTLTGGQPLCATDLTYGVADLDVTIWLEGWDHHVIDQENHHSFNLGLQFQISRL